MMTFDELKAFGYKFVVIHAAHGVTIISYAPGLNLNALGTRARELRSDAEAAALELATADFVQRRLNGEFDDYKRTG